MSEPLWRTVLKRSADQFRAHPGIWCTSSYGNLHNKVMLKDAEGLLEPFRQGHGQCCIVTMLYCQCLLVAGVERYEDIFAEVVEVLCDHHGLSEGKNSIIGFNDGGDCNSTDDVIAFLLAPLKPAVLLHAPVPILEIA